ncbi:UDP-2,4-diacetamido-2,4,6-trideoxy-beta-L-altropyranose hydrolase [Planomicrobium sp. MB-3u-38]|uniref:UDP-2,4-diacetamido-2,4, 6-trideoxy-beta-L-altropyranose hydrolase n=1 Tax=Planomicrobium sp. MB-3u-38 TaxID=2058318 RepID=UPI000C7E7BA2|nr:UDP-2,4-diacetamido-2,4,6-trideoxy-beta-L-altropyranose hydrolase [Planomicrobium sp. MB-3u-38]PKH10362.1 UDP-2,4-diacetamido-2,4,6-trideoxy-beta-L-altropyranose hydrolase [Planomicrobium sp. MB-3u-38]
MKIVIRTDASNVIGSGHVMRCLTLANQLKNVGFTIIFICRKFPGNSISHIRNQGFLVEELQDYGAKDHWSWIKENWELDAEETQNAILRFNTPVSMIIIDHYSIDSKWEKRIRQHAKKIMVVDDLADRPHDCDLLLDQNYYINMQDRYDTLLPEACTKLLGPNYVLLREEFLCSNIKEISRNGNIKRILIFFGGSDPTGETLKTLKSLSNLNMTEVYLDVVVGESNPQKLKIHNFCRKIPTITFHLQVNNMAELMVQADLAIGAGGSTMWERCILALPSMSIIVANNQKELVEAVAIAGATVNLGESRSVTPNTIQKSLQDLMKNPYLVESISKKCGQIIDYSQVKNRPLVKEVQRVLL